MGINVKELRKFQELWAPVIEAIPAVLDMADKQSDWNRALEIQKLEYEEGQKRLNDAVEEASKRVEAMRADTEAFAQQREKALSEISIAKQVRVDEEIAEKKARDKAISEWKSKISVLEGKFAEVQKNYDKKNADAEKDFADKLQKLEAEVIKLEKRKADAEKVISSLRNTLG